MVWYSIKLKRIAHLTYKFNKTPVICCTVLLKKKSLLLTDLCRGCHEPQLSYTDVKAALSFLFVWWRKHVRLLHKDKQQRSGRCLQSSTNFVYFCRVNMYFCVFCSCLEMNLSLKTFSSIRKLHVYFHQLMHLFISPREHWNLLKIHTKMLLHVSVYDHHRGAVVCCHTTA